VCPEGTTEVDNCPAEGEGNACVALTVCGTTIYCEDNTI
jgi:hypothetical protein